MADTPMAPPQINEELLAVTQNSIRKIYVSRLTFLLENFTNIEELIQDIKRTTETTELVLSHLHNI